MKEKIKDEVLSIYRKIKDAGFEVYLVGGCIRNILMDREVKDWDITTNATPEQIQALFPDSFYDNTFGTVGVPFEEKNENELEVERKNYVEITTFRKESDYGDNRHPNTIEWGKTLEEDLSRRDFTINALAGDIQFVDSTHTINILDPYNGQQEISNQLIKAVGNPYERFREDALRVMRGIRFASQFGFRIEEETWKAIKEAAHLLNNISYERIRDELLKIIESDHAYEGIQLLDEARILDFILPELTKNKDLSQERPGRHHIYDVFTHSLLALKLSPSKDPYVRLATLIHDVGKAYTVGYDEDNLITFHNHEIVGAKKALEIADRLRLSKKQKEKMYTLVRWHMFTVDEHLSDSAIRRFIRRAGLDNKQLNKAVDRIKSAIKNGEKKPSVSPRKYIAAILQNADTILKESVKDLVGKENVDPSYMPTIIPFGFEGGSAFDGGQTFLMPGKETIIESKPKAR